MTARTRERQKQGPAPWKVAGKACHVLLPDLTYTAAMLLLREGSGRRWYAKCLRAEAWLSLFQMSGGCSANVGG